MLDDDNKVKEQVCPSSPGKKLKKRLSPKQAEIVQKIYNKKLR